MRLINADELQKALAKKWYEAPEKLSGIKVSMLIEEQPTIEERKIGKWIKTDKHDIYYQPGYKCSVCEILTTYHGSYCPNCGAKMEGE